MRIVINHESQILTHFTRFGTHARKSTLSVQDTSFIRVFGSTIAETKYMLDNGIVIPSPSSWASPCLLLPIRKVNNVTESDSFSLPAPNDHGCCRSGRMLCVDDLDSHLEVSV